MRLSLMSLLLAGMTLIMPSMGHAQSMTAQQIAQQGAQEYINETSGSSMCDGCMFDCSDSCYQQQAAASGAQSAQQLAAILGMSSNSSGTSAMLGYSTASDISGFASSMGLTNLGVSVGSNGSIGLNLGFLLGDSSSSSSSTGVASSVGSYGGGTIGDLLCEVAYWFMGSIGQGIATLAVIVLGIGALMGKVSHGMVLTTLVGIAVIFGAPDIVQDLTGQAACYG